MVENHPAPRPRCIFGGGRRQRQARRRASLKPRHLVLEGRTLMAAAAPIPIPTTNPVVDLSSIFWNGEATPLNPGGKKDIPSPDSVGAAKTIKITNTGPNTIYPFLRGQNGGMDPHASPPAHYDPQDRMDHEFREYVGYSMGGTQGYLGLPSGASITIQVPLALWDGDNLYLATDGTYLTSANIFGYDPNASIAVVSSSPVGGSTWVRQGSNYPAGQVPLVMFYYSGGAPITLPNDAPAQLTEVTFRDEYLAHFLNDPFQTYPLINYDVSYVNNLVAPISMEGSLVPITYQTDPLPAPPTYFGAQDFGWLATDRDTATFEGAIANFTNNTGGASVGAYFGGKGWPQYYNPNPADVVIPSGANLFDNSPLDVGPGLVHTSSYDSNRWLLTSSGNAPIQAGGAGYGQQGFVKPMFKSRIYLNDPTPEFINDLTLMMKQGVVDVSYPGSTPVPLAQVTGYKPNPGGMPYVTLGSPIPVSVPSGKVYAFTRTATDYATTDITNLWYSWAQYNVQQYQNFAPDPIRASLGFTANGHATNEITLASNPKMPLALGMGVTAPSGLPSGATILKISGNHIYLSQIPDDATPASQVYTFTKPKPLAYDPNYTRPYKLGFNKTALPNAKQFAASVYEALAVESTVDPLPPYLPRSMRVVSQVIKFYANLPGYDRPDFTGATLVGEVRDVVKSVLRGVYDYNQVPDQTKWYPAPGSLTTGLTSGQKFNVFNLDPYVWFVHDVEGMSAYGFSVDDDVSNPTATGPLLEAGGAPNHTPNDLQIQFGGANQLGNTNQWFPTIPWGTLTTTKTLIVQATLGIQPAGQYGGDPIITFTGPDALRVYNQINNPGTGQVGANVVAPGYITLPTTLIHKGPTSGLIPSIVLSQRPTKLTTTPIPVTITAGPLPTLGLRRRRSKK